MREIKFRLINTNRKIVGYEKWYPGLWEDTQRGWRAQPIWLYSPSGEYWNPDFIPHHTKDAFTGLRDKNGKEVFEGDIVKSNDGERDFFDEIKISPYHGTMFGKNPRYELGLPHGFEIIGNIYENPELIK